MSVLPEPVLAALAAHTDEFVTEALRTGARFPLGTLGEEQVLSPVWVVLTPSRVWAVAAEGDHAWVRASGLDDALRLEKGWVSDEVSAAGVTLPVRTGTRRQAEQLVEAWVDAPRGGSPVHPPRLPSRPPGRARAARAAEVPDWWPDLAPAEPDERWLLVLETATTYRFPEPDAALAAPVWLGLTDRRAVLLARDGHARVAWREVEGPLARGRRGGRVLLTGQGVALSGSVWGGGGVEDLAAALSAAEPSPRWAILAQHLVEQHEGRRALDAWQEALELGHAEACWSDIARFAWIACDIPRAHAALVHALRLTTLEAGDRTAWSEPVSAWQKTLRRPQTAAAALAETLGPAIDALQAPALPEPFPRPAADEVELWTGALASLGRWSDAEATTRALPETPRGLQFVAALRTVSGHGDARGAWREAAQAWHAAGALGAAQACLARAMGAAPEAQDLWRTGAWAWSAGTEGAAREAWRQALVADPTGDALTDELSDPEAWRLLAALAEGQEVWALAARAWRHAHALLPDDRDIAWALATVLADRLGEHDTAAEVLTGLAERLEEADPAQAARAWLQVAGWLPSEAREQSLRHAVAVGFLEGDTLARALALGDGVPGPTLDWWRHLQAVLGGAPTTLRGAPPCRSFLSSQDLDALHPGGTGWLQALRATLEEVAPPERAGLVRGLQRLEEGWPEAADALAELCHAVRLERPDAFLYRGEGAWGVAAWPTSPPVLLVGVRHAEPGARHLTGGALRFALAVELAHLACGHPLLEVDTTVLGTSRSMYAALGRYAGAAEDVIDLVTLLPGVDQLSKVERVVRLGRKVFAARHTLDKTSKLASPLLRRIGPSSVEDVRGLGREGLRGAALQFRLQADRAGLVLTGDLGGAVDAMLRTSTTALPLADRVRDEGLSAVLRDPSTALTNDEAVRLGALLAFAARQGPFVDEALLRLA